MSDGLKYFMISLILGNLIVLSLDHYPINTDLMMTCEYLNIAFVGLYGVELLIKLLAFGISNFFKGPRFNLWDTSIFCIGLIDIVLSALLVWDHREDKLVNSIEITVFKAFRMFRIFKLARHWYRFELLLETMSKTVIDISSFSIVVGIFMYIYTILGMDWFSHRASGHGSPPTFNFDDF